MPQIILNAYPLEYHNGSSYGIALCMGGNSPRRTAEVKTVDDCKAAVKAFAAEMEITGKPWQVSAIFNKRGGGRKPSGFDKACTGRELEMFVNKHLAPTSAF